MKNILLLTDFSANSINAIRYAQKLFTDFNCRFIVLHVQNSSSYISDDLMLAGNKTVYDSLISKSKNKLEALIASLKSELDNKKHIYKGLIDYDVLTDAIKQIQHTEKLHFVVMGTNGETGAKEVIFGSNTINVIRNVDCPTLVIPQGFKYRPVKEILLPLDTEDSTAGKAFKELLEFTEISIEKIHVLRIQSQDERSEQSTQDKNNLKTLVSNLGYEYHLMEDITMPQAIKCYTQTHKIDMVTLIEQNESIFERILSDSQTRKISNTATLPLLVFHS